jgi:PAS domain S-box-containing protein
LNRLRRSDWRALALLWERLARASDHEVPGLVAAAVAERTGSKSPFDKAFVARVDRALKSRLGRTPSPVSAARGSEGGGLEDAFNSMPAGILVWDADMNVVTCNPRGEQILKLSLSNARGKPVKDALKPREGFMEGVTLVTKAGKPYTRQSMLINLEGDPRTIGYSGAPIPGTGGRPKGWVLLFQDISAFIST